MEFLYTMWDLCSLLLGGFMDDYFCPRDGKWSSVEVKISK